MDATFKSKWFYYLGGYGAATPAIGTNGTVFVFGNGNCFNALAGTVAMSTGDWPRFRGNTRNTGRLE